MSSPRLVAIELEGFRGFAKAQRLSLDADAVLVRGANGSGKTSLVDGLLWVLCGDLAYLAERVRKLRRNEPIVQNRFTDVPARVALEVSNEQHDYVFERSGGDRATRFEARRDGRHVSNDDAALAEVFGHASIEALRAAVLTWGLLRQDAVRATLDTAGGTLHERLAGIVGLEHVSGFASAASSAAKDLQTSRTAQRRATDALRQRYEEAVDRHRAVERDATTRPPAETWSSRLTTLANDIGGAFYLQLPNQLEPADLAELGRRLAAVSDSARELARWQDSLASLGSQRGLDLEAAERDVESAQQHLSDVDRGPAKTRLARAALELLDGDVCPVCSQTVRQEQLRRHLEELLHDAEQLFPAADNAALLLARARERLEAARARRELEEQERRAAAVLAAEVDACPELRLRTSSVDGEFNAAGFAAELGAFVDELRAIYRTAAGTGAAHIERLASEAIALQQELSEAEHKLRSIETQYADAKALERKAHEAAEKIVAGALRRLEPSFAEVFDRLNPNPVFTELRARQDVLRNVNQVVPFVRDPQLGIEANPMLVFSEGQLNVVALSYFLGMALNARDATLPFLVLDDPLQALDTIAVLGFGDLCRRIRDERQLILTTHDRRFADILMRKLSPRDPANTTIVHNFEGWTRSGPSVSTAMPEMAEVIPLLRRRAS